MPIYEYFCTKCDVKFENLIFKENEEVLCPYCHNKNINRLMSSFAHKTGEDMMVSSKSGCTSCSSGNCSSCH